MSFSKKTRFSDLINWRIKVHTIDNRYFVGTLLSFDGHMNVILGDCEERRIPNKQLNANSKDERNTKELRRNLGLIILRGGQIIDVTVEGPGPSDPSSRVRRPIKQPVAPSKSKSAPSNKERNPTSRPFYRPPK